MAELVMTEEGSTPSTPASTKWKVYFKSTGLYILEDTGVETGPLVKGASGTYTPTSSNPTNIAVVTPGVCQYMRVGSVVTVSGIIVIDTTAAGNTLFEISLPIASNLSASTQLAGIASSYDGAAINETAQIVGVAANDTAQFRFYAVGTASRNWFFTFTYLII